MKDDVAFTESHGMSEESRITPITNQEATADLAVRGQVKEPTLLSEGNDCNRVRLQMGSPAVPPAGVYPDSTQRAPQ